MQGITETAKWIEGIIKTFCSESAENSLKNGTDEKAWAEPLVGFSRGDDPLYVQIRNDIGPFYLLPEEIFSRTFPDSNVSPYELTIVSWVLPQTRETKSDHRREKTYPSERWARSRLYGEVFNGKLRQHVAQVLKEAGFDTVAPVDAPFWARQTSERYGICSNWSERHAAYVSGLGTFGLCDGLITAAGKAMRTGSVIARIAVEPTARPYADHHAYCFFYNGGKCSKCIERCPVGAISEKGHDKVKCRAYLDVTLKYVKYRFRLETYACGLCQTGVPCESGIPRRGGSELMNPGEESFSQEH